MANLENRAELERPDLFRFQRPTSTEAGLYGLTLVVAADLAGIVPDGWGSGAAVGLVATAAFVKRCVRPGR
ncbi:hypothetical protein ACIP2X_37325 [Streptomyces sp. NPDC089424]|uniref:hypothetical protein n=1 Tax=Streptomyces sp. NPDC089424 TaxID=3365917 RepID=UPI0037F17E8F